MTALLRLALADVCNKRHIVFTALGKGILNESCRQSMEVWSDEISTLELILTFLKLLLSAKSSVETDFSFNKMKIYRKTSSVQLFW